MTIEPVKPNNPPGTLIEGEHGWFNTPQSFFILLMLIVLISIGIVYLLERLIK